MYLLRSLLHQNKAKSELNGFLVSKETVVLRRWERSKQKFRFIKRVDKGWITTVKDDHGRNSTLINSFDKTKFLYKSELVSTQNKNGIIK